MIFSGNKRREKKSKGNGGIMIEGKGGPEVSQELSGLPGKGQGFIFRFQSSTM
jgi:hypothetical protein